MTLKEKAAAAIDNTLNAATTGYGIHTDKARETLAAWLDGAIKIKASTVRAYCEYLNSIR